MGLSAAVNKKQFRPDINGLRAWAVLAVVLYHYAVPGWDGGFAGVDVFFVVSGFLMTHIILAALDSEAGFSLRQFWAARARRTVPALLVLCASILLLGWFILPTTDYQQLAQHTLASLSGLSNLKFWREIGYFDINSQEKWLLHTWSLSVEWQFYVLFPLLLPLAWRWRRARLGTAVGCALAASLLLSILLSPSYPGTAFYLLPTRAWEMLAGSLVLILAQRIALTEAQRRGVELAGIVLLAVSFAAFDGDLPWPGWRALLPVAGSALILLAARERSLWTANPVAQWIGTTSYSIYLWHWPLAVALRYMNLQHEWSAVLGALALTVALSYASWSWIEQPGRAWRFGRDRASACGAALLAAVPLAAGAIALQAGVPGRIAPYIDQVFFEANNKNDRYGECYATAGAVSECRYGGPRPGVIVMGDSHAQAVMRTVEKALPSQNLHVLDWSLSGCPTLAGVKTLAARDTANCGSFVSEKIKLPGSVAPEVPLIILNRLTAYAYTMPRSMEKESPVPRIYFDQIYAAQTPAFFQQFRASMISTACAFARTRPVFLVRPTPEMERNVPRVMGMALLRGRHERISVSLAQYHERNRFVWEAQDAARAQCGVRILDPLPYLCDGQRCYGDHRGLPIYIDDNHLSERGAALLQPMFESALRQPTDGMHALSTQP